MEMSRGHHTYRLLLLIFTLYPVFCQASWMWLGLTSARGVEQLGCSGLPFTREQKELCRKRPLLLPSIQAGARLGLAECQTQFKYERWNCTTSKELKGFKDSKDAKDYKGSKEFIDSKNSKGSKDSTGSKDYKYPKGSKDSKDSKGSKDSKDSKGSKDPKDSKDFSVFGYELTSGTKEAAFIHAVMAAGLVHAVTRACSQGSMAECGCDVSLQSLGSTSGNLQSLDSTSGNLQSLGSTAGNLQSLGSTSGNLQSLGSTSGNLQSLGSTTGNLQRLGSTASIQGLGSTSRNMQGLGSSASIEGLGSTAGDLQSPGSTVEGWQWGGCSDHTHYATWFSRKFLDGTPRNASSLQAVSSALLAVNQHNSDSGRQAVERTMLTDCRCHGVSGSCAVKTCWRSLAPFERVGAALKERFENSVEVLQRFSRQKVRRKDKLTRRVPVGREGLVFLNKSPNYCLEDAARGTLGTRGRQCSRTSRGADGCGLLCCGRGYNTRLARQVTRCHCKFVWCCYVRCRRCESMADVHTCK